MVERTTAEERESERLLARLSLILDWKMNVWFPERNDFLAGIGQPKAFPSFVTSWPRNMLIDVYTDLGKKITRAAWGENGNAYARAWDIPALQLRPITRQNNERWWMVEAL